MMAVNTEIQELAVSCVDNAEEMKVHTVRLNAVQGMVMRLLHEMDGLEGKVSPQTEYFIENFVSTLRVIDLAFYPLMQDVDQTVEKLNKNTERLASLVD